MADDHLTHAEYDERQDQDEDRPPEDVTDADWQRKCVEAEAGRALAEAVKSYVMPGGGVISLKAELARYREAVGDG